MTRPAVVLLSGGMDSATTLAIASDQGYVCHALSINYGQRHAVELTAAKNVAALLQVREHKILDIDLTRIGGSALTDTTIAVPEQPTSGIPATYVPARNTIFLALALAYAEVLPAFDIFIGVNAVDYSGYPDCRPEFIAAFAQTAKLATKAGVEGADFQIHTPLISLTKGEIIQTGMQLGVDYALTVSCYQANPAGRACGQCDACRIRAAGFQAAGVVDPTRYYRSPAMRIPDYPFASAFATVNGQRLHYLDEGDKQAPPVVMVHGNPTWSLFFRKPVLALRERWRCIVPDHIGMGLSGRPGSDQYGYTLTDRIDDLETLLEQLGIVKDISLLLHDWGGMIGMGYACRQPQRIKALILMNTAAFHLPRGLHLPWQLKLARSLCGPLLVQGLNAFCRGAIKQCVVRKPLPPAIAHAYLQPYASWSQRLAVLRFIQDIPLHAGDRSYAAVSAIDSGIGQFQALPMLLCWGLRDIVFTADFLNEWRRRFPRAEVHAYEDAGHYLLEDAAEQVVPVIQRFLTNTLADR